MSGLFLKSCTGISPSAGSNKVLNEEKNPTLLQVAESGAQINSEVQSKIETSPDKEPDDQLNNRKKQQNETVPDGANKTVLSTAVKTQPKNQPKEKSTVKVSIQTKNKNLKSEKVPTTEANQKGATEKQNTSKKSTAETGSQLKENTGLKPAKHQPRQPSQTDNSDRSLATATSPEADQSKSDKLVSYNFFSFLYC